MEITDTMRLERFEAGSVIQKHLYASPEIGSTLMGLASRFGITQELYKDFVTIFGDTVLGFYPITALAQNLKGSPSLSSLVTDELVAELQKLLRPIVETSTSIEPKPTPTPTSSIEEDLAEIEKSLHQISPVRTMASDGKQIGYSSTKEDTYSSSQSNIIDENK